MKKINNSIDRGSSFLDKVFPFWAVDDDEIQAEDERIAAEAAARENIDNRNRKKDTSKKDDSGAGGGSGEAGFVNNGTINIGDIHINMGGNNDGQSRRRHHFDDFDDNDDVLDVDFVEVTDSTPPKPTLQTPRLTTQSSNQNLSKKQELTKFVRMGDVDALKELDELIESGDTKLIELFTDNRPLSLWIKRSTQTQRWNKLPAVVQDIVNQQTE